MQSKENLGIAPKVVLAHDSKEYISCRSYRNGLLQLKANHGVEQIGVSVYDAREIEQVIAAHVPDIIQVPINVLDKRLVSSGHLSLMKNYGIEVHARSIYLQGLLFLGQHALDTKFPNVVETVNQLHRIGAPNGITVPQLSLLWVMSRIEIDKVVIGVYRKDHIKDTVIMSNGSLDEEAQKAILAIRFDDDSVLDPRKW